MNITKEQILSLVRHTLTILGSVLIARHIVEPQLWEILFGSVFAVTGLVWGIIDKTEGASALASLVRHVAAIAGGFGLVLSPELVEQIVSLVLAVGSIYLGQQQVIQQAEVISLRTKVQVLEADKKIA